MMLFSNPRFDAQGGGVNPKTVSKFRMRAAAVAVASCMSFIPGLAEAAGLGKITVLSGLGQPLRAEVELNANKEELSGMTVRLAPRDSFQQAGVEYASQLLDLRFTLDKRASGTPVIRVSSAKPINEPFLDFLVELNWPAGRLVREYTFLLDPPEVAAKANSRVLSVVEGKPVASARGGAAESGATEAAAPVVAEPRSRKTPAKAEAKPKAADVAAEKTEAAGTRQVKAGETLGRIAAETQYEGVSLEQMLVGLYRANSDAFVGGNLNRMKAGAILTVPDKEEVAAVSQTEAKKIYQAQAADWNAYRRKLAAAAAQGPAKEDAGSQTAGGRISAKVEEKVTPAEAQKDQVKVSKTDAGAKPAAVGAGKAGIDENQVAKEKAIKEAQERIALLEKNVNDLQKLVEMKNQSLAELQKQAAAKKVEDQKAPVTKPAEPAVAAVPPKPVEPPKPAEAVKPVEPPKPVEAAKPVEPAKPAEPPKTAEPPKPEAEAVKPAEPPKAEEPPKVAEPAKPVEPPKPPAPKKPVLPPPEPEEPSLVDELLEDPLPLVGGAAGLLALLGGFFFYKRRRAQSAEMSQIIPDPSVVGPNSVFQATVGQSVDTGNTTPQSTDFSQTGPGAIDTDEVDPVAEADVYMAYGRDAQAEEILLEALQKDPQRTAIHVKLLEIYAGRKSLKQFETLASELYAQTGGVGAEWDKVAAMGVKLDPANPLYSGSRAAATVVGGLESFDADATLIISPADIAKANSSVQEPKTRPVEATAAGQDLLSPQPSDLGAEPALSFDTATSAADEGESELMSLDFDLATASPIASEVPQVPASAEETMKVDVGGANEISALDFDLDVSSTVKIDSPVVPAPAAAAAQEPAGLDFDLDMGFEAPAAPAALESSLADLSLSLDATPAAADQTFINLDVAPAAAEAPVAAASADNLIDFSLDFGTPTADVPLEIPDVVQFDETPALAAESDSLDIGMVDTGGLEFEVKLSDSAVPAETVEAPAFDMSALSLDLGSGALGAPDAASADVDLATLDLPSASGGAQDPQWEEINTKLDLAKAYEEMGDLEGARELLQEVMAEGPADLVQQAGRILERLDA